MPAEITYTAAQLEEHVAREVTKQRMSDIERTITDGERRTTGALADLKAQISALASMVEKQGTAMVTSAGGLRDEIKKDFATKAEVTADFEKLNTKIETQWSKLVLIVSTVTVVGVVAQFALRFIRV